MLYDLLYTNYTNETWKGMTAINMKTNKCVENRNTQKGVPISTPPLKNIALRNYSAVASSAAGAASTAGAALFLPERRVRGAFFSVLAIFSL